MGFHDSEVPQRAVKIARNHNIQFEGTTHHGEELWTVEAMRDDEREHTVRYNTENRAYKCDCEFMSVHADKNSTCSHCEAVSLMKKTAFLNGDILDEIRDRFKTVMSNAKR